MSNMHDMVELKHVDHSGRMTLGKKDANKTYSVDRKSDGTLVLTPVAIIPERELWIWKNKEALGAVKEGLEQLARGEGVSLGSFAQYADVEIED